MHAIYYTVFLLLHCLLVSSDRTNTNPNTMHDFRIEYSSGRFLLDEKPFILRAGAMPYFRVPRNSWRNSLIAMRGAGLNCVYTPIEWATHEPSPGNFKFEGDQDFQAFLNMAKEERLWAIVKPGPFIGEDRDFGGLPAWLLWQRPGILLNTKHPVYRMFVLRYLREVLARLRPLLAINGGPVIMVELEHSGDKEQTLLFVEELDPLVVIFAGEDISSHHGESMSALEALLYPDVGETVRDRRRVHVSNLKFPGAISKLAVSVQLNLATVWGNVPTGMTHEEAAYLFYNLAAKNESFCVHMFQGGTNFGFSAGAIIMPRSGRFTPLMTAYSSLSALSEDSLPGCNYYIIRDYLVGNHPDGLDRYWKNEFKMDSAGYAPWKHYERSAEGYPWPTAVSYGRLRLRSATCLLQQQTIRRLASSAWHAYTPLTFEYLRQAAGFVLYETIVPRDFSAAVLRTPQLHDRAQVFVGPALMGILSRSAQRLQLPLFALRRGDVLRILVESEGRVALHLLPEQRYKGLTYDKDVTLDNIPLRNWTMYGLPMDNGSLIHELAKSSKGDQECSVQCCPVLYSAEFTIEENISVPLDTHFDMAGWGRGFVFVNGHNLGRYWSTVGPQVSLYVPGSYLRASPAINRLAVLELERAHPLQEVMSVSQPVFARFANRVAPVLTAFLVLTVTLSVVAICARKATAWIYET